MRHSDAIVLFIAAFLVYVVGVATYYSKLNIIYQLAYLAGPLVLVACGIRGGFRDLTLTGPIGALLLWILWLIGVSVASGIPVEQFILGVRIYAPVALVGISIALWPSPEALIERLERAAAWIPILQLPFVLHQFFVVRSSRTIISWDSVVGTFGGDPVGGGDSGGLALSATIACIVTLYLHRHRLVKPWLLWGTLTSTLLILIMSEVKLFLILLPVMIMISVAHTILRRPVLFFGLIAITPLFLMILLNVYQALYWSSLNSSTIEASVVDSFGYFFDETSANYTTGEVGRGASIALWAGDFTTAGERRIAGYGMASTRSNSSVAVGVIGSRFYPLDVGSTAIAQLLWDGGIVAVGLYLLALFMAFTRTQRLFRHVSDALQRDRIGVLRAIVVGIIAMLFYNRTFVDLPFEQLLLGLVVGLIANRYAWTPSGALAKDQMTRLADARPSLGYATASQYRQRRGL